MCDLTQAVVVVLSHAEAVFAAALVASVRVRAAVLAHAVVYIAFIRV